MIKETIKNEAWIEVKAAKSSPKHSTVETGFSGKNKQQIRLKGRVKKNKKSVLGILEIAIEDQGRITGTNPFVKHITKKPKLIPGENVGLDSSIALRLNKKTTNPTADRYSYVKGNVVSYLFDIIYIGKENISKAQPLRFSLDKLKFKPTKMERKTTRVFSVSCGPKAVSPNGETRKITISGDPEAPFILAINRVDANFELSAPASGLNKKHVTDRKFVSILDPKISIEPNSELNGKVLNPYDTRIIKGNLDINGKYIFNQKFPRVSGGTNHYFLKLLHYDTLWWGVSGPPPTHPFYHYTSGSPVKPVSGRWTFWPKEARYWIHNPSYDTWTGQLKATEWGTILDGWEQFYCRLLTQRKQSKITFEATTNTIRYKINGRPVKASASTQSYKNIIWDKLGQDSLKIKYNVSVVDPADTFSKTATSFTFSNTGGTSVFTGDVNKNTNGGAVFNVSAGSCTLSSDAKSATISFSVNVEHQGHRDCLVTLPINSLLNVS